MPGAHRPMLLLSALMTITVPSLLAAYAVLGHRGPARADDGAVRSAPAAAGGPLMTASGVTAASAGEAPRQVSRGLGMQLLAQAAIAGRATSYQGVELITRWSILGTSTVESAVWHPAGGQTVTQTSSMATVTGGKPQTSFDADNRDPEGVFGLTRTLVPLLGAHYDVAYAGQGSVMGRTALVVEARGSDGNVAARFWVDKQTRLPLRREVYDGNAHVISEDLFIQVQFGQVVREPQAESATMGPPAVIIAPRQVKAAAAAAASANAATSRPSSWSEAPVPAELLRKLHAQGLRLPAALPGGLSLYSAAQGQTAAGQVVDLGYSDGLFVVSVFVQRGTLPAKMAGWQQLKLGGHEVFAVQHDITWSGRGYVYTVLADAPPQTVEAVVSALPQNAPPGFWIRMGRGLGRLASLVNPFH